MNEDDNRVRKKPLSNKFPFLFFGSVIAMIAAVIVINIYLYDIRPGNSPEECANGCPGNSNPKACEEFCDCIYKQGKPLTRVPDAVSQSNSKGNQSIVSYDKDPVYLISIIVAK